MRPDLKKEKKQDIGYSYIVCGLCGRKVNSRSVIPVHRDDGKIIEICKSVIQCGDPRENRRLRNGHTKTQR